MTFTSHKLTESMLTHLSATCHGRQVGGNSMLALEDRGLIAKEHLPRVQMRALNWEWIATPAGQEALAQARREGW